MADFVAVIRRAVDGLATNSPEARAKVYEKARGAVQRQLENMKPRPPEEMLRRQMDKLETAIVEVESEHLSVTEVAVETEDLLTIIPRQRPGLSFGLTAEGTIGIRSGSLATDEDLREIGGLRITLSEAVDDLISLTRGSNAYRVVELIANRYKSALQDEQGYLAVDRLYAQGLRLENLAAQLREEAHSIEYPEMALDVAEALDSVIAIHGPTIMSTGLGRDLVARAREYTFSADVEERYRDTAVNLWLESRNSSKFIDPGDLEDVISLNADINSGVRPQQSIEFAHSTNANLIATLAKLVLAQAATIVGVKAFEDTAVVGATSGQITHVINQAWSFFISHREALVALAAVSGGELSWLQSLLRWIELKRRYNR